MPRCIVRIDKRKEYGINIVTYTSPSGKSLMAFHSPALPKPSFVTKVEMARSAAKKFTELNRPAYGALKGAWDLYLNSLRGIYVPYGYDNYWVELSKDEMLELVEYNKNQLQPTLVPIVVPIPKLTKKQIHKQKVLEARQRYQKHLSDIRSNYLTDRGREIVGTVCRKPSETRMSKSSISYYSNHRPNAEHNISREYRFSDHWNNVPCDFEFVNDGKTMALGRLKKGRYQLVEIVPRVPYVADIHTDLD